MTQQPRRGTAKRMLSLVGTAALALTGAFALGGTAASASPGDIVAPEDGGSITVHKHVGAPSEDPGAGTEITDPGGIAELGLGLEDVEFKLQRVTYNGVAIDLATSEGWEHLPATVPASEVSPYGLEDVSTPSSQTDSSGVVVFSNLPLGLYVVTELPGAPGVEEVAPPFLVSVPHRAANDSTWNYNVHVYPKNRLADNPTKTVSEPDGNEVTWTITTTVPRPPEGNQYTSFSITDELDPRLTFQSATVTRDGVALPDSVVTNTGQLVTVTPPLDEVRTGQTYVITIVTSVDEPGSIVNDAVRNVNGTEVTIGPAQTNWGAVKVMKYETGTQDTLTGAKFELWSGDKSTKLLDEATTGLDGTFTFEHIWLGNGTTTTRDVCLKETQAPAGHSISNEWTCITLDSAETGVVNQRVDNPKRDTPHLPLTGASGSVMFMGGGLALLLAAGGVALIISRKHQKEAPTE